MVINIYIYIYMFYKYYNITYIYIYIVIMKCLDRLGAELDDARWPNRPGRQGAGVVIGSGFRISGFRV